MLRELALPLAIWNIFPYGCGITNLRAYSLVQQDIYQKGYCGNYRMLFGWVKN